MLTGNIKRRAKLAAGQPPKARARLCTIWSSRAVRRAQYRVEPLVENAAPAEDRAAAETPGKKHKPNPAAWVDPQDAENIDCGSVRISLRTPGTGSSSGRDAW